MDETTPAPDADLGTYLRDTRTAAETAADRVVQQRMNAVGEARGLPRLTWWFEVAEAPTLVGGGSTAAAFAAWATVLGLPAPETNHGCTTCRGLLGTTPVRLTAITDRAAFVAKVAETRARYPEMNTTRGDEQP